MDVLAVVFVALLCLAAGALIGWFAAQSKLAAEVAGLRATLAASRVGEQRLEQSLRALSHESIAQNNSAFSQLVAPIRESLHKVEAQVSEVERDRVEAYATLRQQVHHMHQTSEQLRVETSQLVSALRAPQVRGRWGEHQLRRIVEVSGMLEHCDFTEQTTSTTVDGTLRPDMVVTLAGGKNVVVDAKVPFSAYLEAMESRDERHRNTRMDAHARHLRSHVDVLGSKAYWERFDPSPEFVVLFVPGRHVPRRGAAARAVAAGARVQPERGARDALHPGRAAPHDRLHLAAGGPRRERRRGARARPRAALPHRHDGQPHGEGGLVAELGRVPVQRGGRLAGRPRPGHARASSPSCT